MRTCVLWNEDWSFIREDVGPEAVQGQPGEPVTLPHTWNAADGQDGGNDYYRGVCWYTKRFPRPAAPEGGSVWLEFRGAAMTAEIWLNGKKLGRHEGGYSTFRVDLTEALADDNLLAVSVDNGPNRRVYPQKADFTFYGGIYRDVYLLTVPAAHFALDCHGGPAIKVTPTLSEDAFYVYKAYLSEAPFVHICGSRYVDRPESETEVKVYSNQPQVTLYVDGRTVETQRGDKVFRFKAPITGKHSIMARAGDCSSVILIQKVDAPNPGYRKPGGEVVNWFDQEDELVREGCFSILDPMGQVKAHPQTGPVLMELLEPLQTKVAAAYGDVAKSVQIPENIQRMMDQMSVQDTLKQMGRLVTPEFIHKLNAALNQVKK